MPLEPLNEPGLRREDFVEGTPVVMADGQTWHLRRPLVWFVPHDGNPGGFRICISLEPNDDYQELLDARTAAMRKEGGAKVQDVAGPELTLGQRLLLANYDLTSEQVARVLRFGYDRDENPDGFRIREEVMDVAEGLGPKPSPDGTDASPTPSGDYPGATA